MKIKDKIEYIKNVYYYIQGNIRYFFYYYAPYLIQDHILEQINYRIASMDLDCYNDGSCKLCGCTTTKLQMCNKTCDEPCYPKMMGWLNWEVFKIQGNMDWDIDRKTKKFIKKTKE